MQDSLGTPLQRYHQNFGQVLQSYYQLTKPRIILLLLITTAGGMWVAAHGAVNLQLLMVTLIGGAMASASANTINCLYDRDIDLKMVRTQTRPLPSGRIQPQDALIFAIALAAASFALLTVFANLLAASLAMSGIVCYVLVYTHWLKRHSTQNIVIGGAAGAIPPLVGWAAVTGELSWAAWILFAIIFFWTPPHFWALAVMIREDYAKVGVPMLPVVEGNQVTADQIFYYTLALLPISCMLVYPLGVAGVIYLTVAFGLGSVFIYKAWQFRQAATDVIQARSVFKFSILYLMLLFAGLVVDILPFGQTLTTATLQSWDTLISTMISTIQTL